MKTQLTEHLRKLLPKAAWAAAGLCALAAPAQAGTRYRCRLPDGVVLLTADDLGAAVKSSGVICRTFTVADAKRGVLPPVPAVAASSDGDDNEWVTLGLTQRASSRGSAVRTYSGLVREISLRHGMDPALVSAVIAVESGQRATARSGKGALGLMQIMPGTGARYGVLAPEQLLDPAVNIDVGVRYLKDLQRLFNGTLSLVLAAYNAGEGAVLSHGYQVPPFAETQEFVRRVMSQLPVGGT